MRKLLVCLFLLALISTVFAAGQEAIPIWPKGAPGEKGDIGEEQAKSDGPMVGGKPVIRVTNVTVPTITVYRPAKGKQTGAAVIVFPGGGYNILAINHEGSDVCEWLNSFGVIGVLLKYRVPARKGLPRHAAPLQDAQRAISLVRSRAAEWNIDANRIGVLGFSAGGHLAAAASTNFDKRTYDPQDDADQVTCRPDFALLIYPAYLALKEEGNRLAPEIPVTAKTPPSFLVQAEDDRIRVENSLFYYLALKNANVPAEMHLFPKGGHGYGLRSDQSVRAWPRLAEEWLRALGVLRSAN